jgi:hypothetical protein
VRKDWEGRTAGAATACARAEKALTALRWETRFALSFAPATEVLAQRACWEMAAIVFVGVDGKGDVRRKCAEERGGPSIWLCQLGGHTNIDGRRTKRRILIFPHTDSRYFPLILDARKNIKCRFAFPQTEHEHVTHPAAP